MVALLAILFTTGTPSALPASAAPGAENLLAWQSKMQQEVKPAGTGCFTARYPDLLWTEVGCVAAPATPMTPRGSGQTPTAPGGAGVTPMTVGSRDHIVAETPAGAIYRAAGTFEEVTGVVSVRSPLTLGGPEVPNAYTLQLNTNYFPTTECNPASPSCDGWQQFIFANDGSSGLVFIEYWMRDYATKSSGTTCPDTWETYEPLGDFIYCYKDTPAVPVEANTPIKDMSRFALTGDLSGAVAEVIFTPDADPNVGQTLYTHRSAKVLDPGANWRQTEFNVFGYGNGTEAVFNSTASTRVRTRIDYGGNQKPGCTTVGFTAESNNLFFGDLTTNPPAVPTVPKLPATAGPARVFWQKSGTGLLSADCIKSVSIGDTHQVTFAGLLYDFQAAGDFVEAQTGTGFEVQSRKVSGAPNWPNASVNRSAGVRMGSTTVAVCEGTRLFVDGAAAAMPPGGAVTLPSGVRIERTGNVHYIRDRAGNSLRVELRGSYVDLHVGLGRWPQTVRGLLGNPNNDPNRLESRDGVQFVVPSTFNTQFFDFLYTRFGPSWQVPSNSSLLSTCNTVTPRRPTAPFFANDLPAAQRQWAESACRSAGVATAWLDACALDTAVFGTTSAAAVYVNRQAPVVNGNRLPPPCSPTGAGCRELRGSPVPPAGGN